MTSSKKTLINVVSAMVLLIITSLINFLVTPFIIKHIGTEANGFISLASNFVAYATIVTVAFNSMAGRFVTINLHRHKIKTANEYYNTVLFVNLAISLVTVIGAGMLVISLNKVLTIPVSLVGDVKLLFGLVFINFCLNLITEVLVIVAYATDNLYKISLCRTLAVGVRLVVLLMLFKMLPASVYFVGLAAVVSSIALLILVKFSIKDLAPELRIKLADFKFNKIKKLVMSGIWNTLTTIGNILSDGLDLLMSNLFISPLAMGILAIPKTVNTIASSFLSTVTTALVPRFTIAYAKRNDRSMLGDILTSMKFNGIMSSMMFSWLFVFSGVFFAAWVPSQNHQQLWLLGMLSFQSLFWSGNMDPLFAVFGIANKLKVNALLRLGGGAVAVLIVYVFLQTTNWGLYVIAGVSPIIGNLINLCFVPSYIASTLKSSARQFYLVIARHLLATSLSIIILLGLQMVARLADWSGVLISLPLAMVVAVVINYMIIFSAEDRTNIQQIFRKLLTKGTK